MYLYFNWWIIIGNKSIIDSIDMRVLNFNNRIIIHICFNSIKINIDK